MTTHTEGPWFADARGRIWRRPPSDLYENGGGVAGDKPIAVVSVGWAGEGVTGYPVEDNARLIAAAPDLLEACETFAEWLGREESGFARAGNKRDTPEGERAWRDWYNENLRLCALAQEQARAAIARATGEQP